jgi:hypothetical protein
METFLTTALRDLAWGANHPLDNVHTTVHTMLSVEGMTWTVELRVQVTPRRVTLFNRATTVPNRGIQVRSVASIPMRDILHHRLGSDDRRLMVLGETVRKAAPLLYEADPRIGSCARGYPTLPLFDPPNGVDAMRRFSGCALCGRAVPDPGGAGHRAWGGGNIGWVHPTCLGDVYP